MMDAYGVIHMPMPRGTRIIMTGTHHDFPMQEVIESGVDLDQFDSQDWSYEPYGERIRVRNNTPMLTYLLLKLG
jgi:hypothetical protein